MNTLEYCANSANPRIEDAYDRAVEAGHIGAKHDADYKGTHNYKHGMYQAIWRGWAGDDWNRGYEINFDYRDATTAVLDALIHQGGIAAWDGDGVSCVVQMLEFAYENRDYWKQRAIAAEKINADLSSICKCGRCGSCNR